MPESHHITTIVDNAILHLTQNPISYAQYYKDKFGQNWIQFKIDLVHKLNHIGFKKTNTNYDIYLFLSYYLTGKYGVLGYDLFVEAIKKGNTTFVSVEQYIRDNRDLYLNRLETKVKEIFGLGPTQDYPSLFSSIIENPDYKNPCNEPPLGVM